MKVELWEWAVVQGGRHNPVGVSGTRRGAVTALSRALRQADRSAQGSVGLLMLVDTAHEGRRYQRLPVRYSAVFSREGCIEWSQSPVMDAECDADVDVMEGGR
jgi:hypothetical protein